MAQKPQSRLHGKLFQAAREAKRHLPMKLPPVFLLTDPKRVPDPVAAAETLPHGWGIIYRHFGAENREQVARHLKRVARRRQLSFLVAADPHLARSVNADGIHWPHALGARARSWKARFSISTISAHSPAEARRAAASGCDAILMSTVFPSNSPSARAPLGPIKLRAIAAALPCPVYGLGGINSSNAGSIASVAGIAGIEGIIAASD